MRFPFLLLLAAFLAAPVSAQTRSWSGSIGRSLPRVSRGPAAFAAKNLANPSWELVHREKVLAPVAAALTAKGLTVDAFDALSEDERAALLQAALEGQIAQAARNAKSLVDEIAKVNSGENKFEPEGAEEGLRASEDLLFFSSPYLDDKLHAQLRGAHQILRLRVDDYKRRALQGRLNQEASKLAPREDEEVLAPQGANASSRLSLPRRARSYAAIDQTLQRLSAEVQPRIDFDTKLSAAEKERLQSQWSAAFALADEAAKKAPSPELAAKLHAAVEPLLGQFWRFHDEDFMDQFGRGKKPDQSAGLPFARELERQMTKAAPRGLRGALPELGAGAARLELTQEVLAALLELKALALDYIAEDPHLSGEERLTRASAWERATDTFIPFKRQARPDLTIQEASSLRESLKIPIFALKESLQLDPLLAGDREARKALTLSAERLADCLERLSTGTHDEAKREGLWRAADKIEGRLFLRAHGYYMGRSSPYDGKKALAILGKWSAVGAAIVGQDAAKARGALEPLLPEFKALVAKDPELKPSERAVYLDDCDRLLDLLKSLGA